MRKRVGIVAGSALCGLVGVAVAISSAQAVDEPAAAKAGAADQYPSTRELQDKIASLEKQVEQLQQRVRELEQRPPLTIVTQSPGATTPPAIMPLPRPQQMAPPGASPFNFNGYTYYVVPLQEGAGPARAGQAGGKTVVVAPSKPVQTEAPVAATVFPR